MKRVIINADDFGLSEEINLGIIKTHREGIVTNTSIVINGNLVEHGLPLIKQAPNLGVGIHLNLTYGKPTLPKNECKTLTDQNGRFLGYPKFIQRLILHQVNLEEVKKELRAQIERFLSYGIECSHIDSHKHIGYLPQVLNIILELAHKFKISKMRFPNETAMPTASIYQRGFLKRNTIWRCWISFLAKRSRAKLHKYRIAYPDYFFGISQMGHKEKENIFESILKSCREGISEIMCHPSLMEEKTSKPGYGKYGPEHRYRELRMLIDPRLKEVIKEMNLKLISFDEMSLS
ncbi:MAG TPA: ChbG/HpnK family deacetylase [Nitrospinota bacterium]|nr:ChbG/HpnK family deacetylase [Nitrospinota bacterium]